MAFLPAIAGLAELAGGTASISTAVGLGASLLGAAGSVMQGNAAQQAQEYNARVLRAQAKVAQDQAAMQSANIVDATRRKIGTAIASGEESGIETSEGSFRDLLANTSTFGHLDALNAIYKGTVQATGYRNQASADVYAGSQAALGGWLGAGTSLLRGVSTAFKRTGSTVDLMDL